MRVSEKGCSKQEAKAEQFKRVSLLHFRPSHNRLSSCAYHPACFLSVASSARSIFSSSRSNNLSTTDLSWVVASVRRACSREMAGCSGRWKASCPQHAAAGIRQMSAHGLPRLTSCTCCRRAASSACASFASPSASAIVILLGLAGWTAQQIKKASPCFYPASRTPPRGCR